MKAALELSSKPNRNGLFEIYVRIQEGDKKKRIKANVAVKKNQFKSKNHNLKWVQNHPNHLAINSDLRKLIEEYDDLVFNGSIEKKILSPETIIHSKKSGAISKSLVNYCEMKMSQILNYNHKNGLQTHSNKFC